ncbi:DUF4817 domain-containing protein [Trichonephila clavipes]|nr:DUF4817 domain-containing protein [Trichonephila clavipes]
MELSVALPLGAADVVQHNAPQLRKSPFTIVLTSTMGDLTYAENAHMHYVYDSANGNGRAQLRMHHTQFSDRRMPDHIIFQWLHRQLLETRSFHVTRHDAGRRRHVCSPTLEERILNVGSDRPESSTRAFAHYVSVSHQPFCNVKRKSLTPVPFSASTSFKPDRLSSPAASG